MIFFARFCENLSIITKFSFVVEKRFIERPTLSQNQIVNRKLLKYGVESTSAILDILRDILQIF